MHDSVEQWFRRQLPRAEQVRKTCLEVGSLDVNGSLRDMLPHFDIFLGLDMRPGPGVDVVANMEAWPAMAWFDFIISAGTLEHCEDWRGVINSMKSHTKIDGSILLTTVMPGFGRHNHPDDFWRFPHETMLDIFADWDVENVEFNDQGKDIFIRARRPPTWVLNNRLDSITPLPTPP